MAEGELALEAGDRGPLAANPEHVLAFRPGLRTRDDGELGDRTGEIAIRSSAAAGAKWRLFRNATLVATTETTAGQPLRLLATRGGRHLLTIHDPNNDDLQGKTQVSIPQFVHIGAPRDAAAPSLAELGIPEDQRQDVWDAILEAARPICHHILRPANVRLIWPGEDLPEPFIYHGVPDEGDVVLSPAQSYKTATPDGVRQFYQIPTTVLLASPASTLCDIFSDPAASMQALANYYQTIMRYYSAAQEFAESPLQVLFGHFLADPDEDAAVRYDSEPAWGFDGRYSALDIGVARVGLGAFDFAGDTIAGSDTADADRVLAALAFTTDASGARSSRIDWADPDSAPYKRYIEMAGRQVGVLAARATLRMIGVPAEAGHITENDGDEVVLSNLMAPAPHDPLRDILGLHRPPDRAFAQLPGDLNNQQTRASNANGSRSDKLPQDAKWVDLVALEQSGIRTERAMPGPLSAYDALAGVVSDESLDFIDTRLGKLPPAYGPYEMRPGDRDRAIQAEPVPVYGGAAQPEGRPADDIIAVLQRDLHAIGIGLGLPGPEGGAEQTYDGFYGYRRFTHGNAKYDGDLAEQPGPRNRAELKRGHSEWAVREFQIASSYSNSVAERINIQTHYTDRLHIVEADPDPEEEEEAEHDPEGEEDDPPAQPSQFINGRLTVNAGDQLRQWRFQRRRNPIVIVAGSDDDALTPPANLELGQNLNRLDGFTNGRYRMYAFDRSGHFGGEAGAVKLAYCGGGGWGGPANTPHHGIRRVTTENTIGDIVPDPMDDFRSAYRVVAAVAEVEAVGNFDGLNAWDNAVFSYPLFHHTLTLGGGRHENDDGDLVISTARPGQMAGFVRWLQDPLNDLLEEVFPDAGGAEPPNHPNPYPADQEQVTDRRNQLRDRFHKVFHNNFGRFGIGAGATAKNPWEGFITAAGLRRGTTPAGNEVNMDQVWPGATEEDGWRQQALYQAYQQWFRTWPWFYRFAAALRQDQTLRTIMFAYELDWIDRRIEDVVGDIRTERGRAAYIRVAVRGKAEFNADDALRAVTGARSDPQDNIDEGQAILDAMEDAIGGGEKLFTSTELALDYNLPENPAHDWPEADLGPLLGDRQDNDIYKNVRNDVLRRLIADAD